jgi:hypothetical protein
MISLEPNPESTTIFSPPAKNIVFVTFWLFEMTTSKGHVGLSQNRKRRVIGDDHADKGRQGGPTTSVGGRRALSLITM